MSASSGLDLRYPIGMLFLLLGLILTVFGAVTRANAALYVPSGGININLAWGVVMMLFGGVMSAVAAAAHRREQRRER